MLLGDAAHWTDTEIWKGLDGVVVGKTSHCALLTMGGGEVSVEKVDMVISGLVWATVDRVGTLLAYGSGAQWCGEKPRSSQHTVPGNLRESLQQHRTISYARRNVSHRRLLTMGVLSLCADSAHPPGMTTHHESTNNNRMACGNRASTHGDHFMTNNTLPPR
jgi:hypothetical protein